MITFWIVAALLTACACLAVLWPFVRTAAPADAGHDVEVYRDQLAEVDRDLARGAISPDEAEEAKAEIGRRLLRAAESGRTSVSSSDGKAAKLAASIAVFAVPVLALGIYSVLGSPGMPDQALEGRLAANPAENTIEELIARAERHLADNPEDGRGWDVLAPIYLRVGRNEDAVVAFRNAIQLNGTSSEREAGLGDALFRSAGNIVTIEAQSAFERAIAADPANPKARFFVALGLAQQGRSEAAADRWRAMANDLPADSPWLGAATEAMARLQDVPPQQPEQIAPGPTAEDMQAAAAMSEEDRAAMIEGMVAGLDQRLRDNPDDIDGWRRLIRSYAVLGRPEDARVALQRGLEGLGASTAPGKELAAFAADLGIEVSESQ